VWILLQQDTVSGIGINWTICKSALQCRQVNALTPKYSVSSPDAVAQSTMPKQSTEGIFYEKALTVKESSSHNTYRKS